VAGGDDQRRLTLCQRCRQRGERSLGVIKQPQPGADVAVGGQFRCYRFGNRLAHQRRDVAAAVIHRPYHRLVRVAAGAVPRLDQCVDIVFQRRPRQRQPPDKTGLVEQILKAPRDHVGTGVDEQIIRQRAGRHPTLARAGDGDVLHAVVGIVATQEFGASLGAIAQHRRTRARRQQFTDRLGRIVGGGAGGGGKGVVVGQHQPPPHLRMTPVAPIGWLGGSQLAPHLFHAHPQPPFACRLIQRCRGRGVAGPKVGGKLSWKCCAHDCLLSRSAYR
jgi:hypothetical protein